MTNMESTCTVRLTIVTISQLHVFHNCVNISHNVTLPHISNNCELKWHFVT